jgi:two-component system NtrC family sensor kinase
MNESLTSTITNAADDALLLDQLAQSEKLAELGRLTAGIVHEINTPLSVITSAAQMILREGDLSDFVREMVERIGQEAQRLSQQTRGVLTFARDDEEDTEADINGVAQDVLAFLRYESQKRSIGLVEELDFRLPGASIPANRLKQLLINLVMNALQAMEGGGTLTVRSLWQGERVALQVTDTGRGIPLAIIERIFDPFFTTKALGEGTGLGLYITRRLLEQYGGSIAVESTPGRGTTFTISLLPTAVSP